MKVEEAPSPKRLCSSDYCKTSWNGFLVSNLRPKIKTERVLVIKEQRWCGVPPKHSTTEMEDLNGWEVQHLSDLVVIGPKKY